MASASSSSSENYGSAFDDNKPSEMSSQQSKQRKKKKKPVMYIDDDVMVNGLIKALQHPDVIRILNLSIGPSIDAAINKRIEPLAQKILDLEGKLRKEDNNIMKLHQQVQELSNNFSESTKLQQEVRNTMQVEMNKLVEKTETHEVKMTTTQSGKSGNIIIAGVTEDSEEDLTLKVNNIFQATETTVGHFTAKRIGKKPTGKPILVSFTSVWDKRKVLASRSKLKDQPEMSKVYINEDLTKQQAEVYYHTRNARKLKLIHATNTQNGLVHITTTPNSKPLPINSMEALKRHLPSYSSTQN